MESAQTSAELLAEVTTIQRQFIAGSEPHPAFDSALGLLLQLSGSEFGFIGEVWHTRQGKPFLKTHAITDIAWDAATRTFFAENAPSGFEFHNLKTLFGEVILTRAAVIANDPSNDPRSGGVPPGHPPLEAFLGVPLFGAHGDLVGMAGIANRPGGYDNEQVELLQPVCDSLGVMIVGARRERRLHETEAALRTSEERYRVLVEQATDALFLHDRDGTIVDVNRQACDSLGFECLELIGMTPPDIDPDISPERTAELCARLDAGETLTLDTRHRRKDGSVFPVEIRIRPFWLDGQRHALTVARDVTERKRAEEALKESEERCRLALDAADLGSWRHDLSTDVVRLDARARAVWGFDRRDVDAKEAMSRIHPDDRKRVIEHFAAVGDSGSDGSFVNEFRVRRPDGEIRWLALRGKVHFHREGGVVRPVRSIGTYLDVTERKRAEESLRKQANLLDLTHDAVVVRDMQDRITYWNRGAEKCYGWTAADVIGQSAHALLQTEYPGPCDDIRAALHAVGQWDGELTHVTKDGRRIVVASRWSLDRDAAGQPTATLEINRDITDRKLAEEELSLRQAELLHAARLTTVGQMVAELSHEISQPFSAIGNFAAASTQMLDTTHAPHLATLREYVQAILKQNERCGAILGRLRNFSRRTVTRRGGCDLDHLIRESLELVSSELRRHGIQVRLNAAERLPQVWGDRIQLQQVLVNLLTNAHDAVYDQPRTRKTITVSARAEPDAVVLDVADRGIGLSDDVAAHLFEPFFTTKEHGMGIGLNLCQSIVKDHGGTIVAFSNEVGGATFRVRLPLAGSDDDERKQNRIRGR